MGNRWMIAGLCRPVPNLSCPAKSKAEVWGKELRRWCDRPRVPGVLKGLETGLAVLIVVSKISVEMSFNGHPENMNLFRKCTNTVPIQYSDR